MRENRFFGLVDSRQSKSRGSQYGKEADATLLSRDKLFVDRRQTRRHTCFFPIPTFPVFPSFAELALGRNLLAIMVHPCVMAAAGGHAAPFEQYE